MSKNTSAGVRGTLFATMCLGLLVPGCSKTYHVLADGDGRPMRVYEDAFSCQFAAVWHRERGWPDASCYQMTAASLRMFGLTIEE